jgi:hypothetical protein
VAPDPKQYKKIGPRRQPAAMVRNAIPQARYAEIREEVLEEKEKSAVFVFDSKGPVWNNMTKK